MNRLCDAAYHLQTHRRCFRALPSQIAAVPLLHAAQLAQNQQQQQQRARARLSDQLSSNTLSVRGKPIVALEDFDTTPGSAHQAGPGSSLSFPPAAPSTTLGDICQDPYRPGDIAVVLFLLRPINYLAPHRGTALFYPDASVSHTLPHPPTWGIHPVVGKFQPRPVFAFVYKSWLDHTCLTSLVTYISLKRAVYTCSKRSPVTISNDPPSYTLSLSPSWPLILPSIQPIRTVLTISPTTLQQSSQTQPQTTDRNTLSHQDV